MHQEAHTPSIQPALVNAAEDGALVTNSLRIASGVGNEHKHVLRLIRDNLADFEDFGRVGFENAPFETAGGTQTRTVAILNREQAMLLMTYMRNNEIVRAFKKNLIRAFVEMEKQLSAPALSGKQLLAAALLEADSTMKALESKIAEDAPKVEYHDRFVAVDGDVMTISDWGAHYGLTRPQSFQRLVDAKIIYRKPITREFSPKRGEVIDRNEYRPYSSYRNLFELRAQHNAPRYHNGQVRQTLYVKSVWAFSLAGQVGLEDLKGQEVIPLP